MPDTPSKLKPIYNMCLMPLSGRLIFIYKELESVKDNNIQNEGKKITFQHTQTNLNSQTNTN